MRTVEQQMADYWELQEEVHGPLTIADITDRSVVAVSSARPRRWVAVAGAAAVVLLAGLLPVLLLNGQEAESTPASAPNAPQPFIDPDRPVPSAVPFKKLSGIEWTEIEGPEETLPPVGFTWNRTDGYVAIENDQGVETRWTSSDAANWTRDTVSAPDPQQLVSDLFASKVSDLGDIDVAVTATRDPVRSTEGVTFTPVVLGAAVPWEEYYEFDKREPPGTYDWFDWDSPKEELHLKLPDGSRLASLSIEEDGDTASVVDNDTGETVVVLKGSEQIPLDLLVSAVKEGHLFQGAYFLSTDEVNWSFHLTQWPMANSYFGFDVSAPPEGGLVVTLNDGTGNVERWRSHDGILWAPEPLDLPFMDEIGVTNVNDVQVFPFADRLRAQVDTGERPDGSPDVRSWESTNGIDWTPAQEDFDGTKDLDIQRTNYGWVVTTWRLEGGPILWISNDGTEWTRVDLPDDVEAINFPRTPAFAGGAGDVIYASYTRGSTTHLWIGRMSE